MKKLKKLFTVLAVTLMAGAMITACGSDASEDAQDEAAEETVAAEDAGDASESEDVEAEEESETADDAEEAAAEDESLPSWSDENTDDPDAEYEEIDYDGVYTTKDEVALYIYTYGELPSNYITKSEAKDLGWVSSEGNLDEVAPGMSIGGDKFGNREGLLPTASGRQYYECDIDYEGGYRGGERIVFSNDGLVYYSADHYQDFELLYGEE